MPKIFYTEDEYESLKHEKEKLEVTINYLTELTQKLTDQIPVDNVKGLTSCAHLYTIWSKLKVSNQTDCLSRIEGLIARSKELTALTKSA